MHRTLQLVAHGATPVNSLVVDLPQRTSQLPQQPVRLPMGLIAAVIDVARREGLTRTKALAIMVEYALENRPPNWRP
jgi:hypothetical protein